MFKYFVEMISNFLMRDCISLTASPEIIGDTFLRAAGVTSQMVYSSFGNIPENNNQKAFFEMVGMSLDEAKIFAGYLYAIFPEGRVEIKIKNCESIAKLKPHTRAYRFEVQAKNLYNILITQFILDFSSLLPVDLEKYKLKSLQEIYRKYLEETSRITQLFDSFLLPHRMTCIAVDVVEETILCLANIQTQPIKCQLFPINDTRVHFRVQGIDREEANRLLHFIIHACQDKTATLNFITKKQTVFVEDELIDVYSCEFNIKTINTLFHLFKAAFPSIDRDKILSYQNKSLPDYLTLKSINQKMSYTPPLAGVSFFVPILPQPRPQRVAQTRQRP